MGSLRDMLTADPNYNNPDAYTQTGLDLPATCTKPAKPARKPRAPRAVNQMAKTRPAANPYEVWHDEQAGWTWLVVKSYQAATKEVENPYARRMCYVISPMTYGRADLGDTYFPPFNGPADGQAICVYRDPSLAQEDGHPYANPHVYQDARHMLRLRANLDDLDIKYHFDTFTNNLVILETPAK